MALKVVIDKITKRVKRFGYCDFASLPNFDSSAEEVIEKDFLFDPPLLEKVWKYNTTSLTFEEEMAVSDLDYTETIYLAGGAVDKVITWDSASKNFKKRETIYTYSDNNNISNITEKEYDIVGSVVVHTKTYTPTYQGKQIQAVTEEES